MDLVHWVEKKDAVFAFIVDRCRLLDGLKVPNPDPAVTPNCDQLTFCHHKLLDWTLVASGEVPSSHLHLHLGNTILTFVPKKISHLAVLPQEKVAPLTAGDHLAVPKLDEGLDVGDGLVVEHPAGHVHLHPARRCHDPPEVDVPVPAGDDQGEDGEYLKVYACVDDDAFNTWW